MTASFRSEGFIVAATLPIVTMTFLFLIWVLRVHAAFEAEHRLQTQADTMSLALSTLRAEALEALAQRWYEYGSLLGPVVGARRVRVASSHIESVKTLSDRWRQARIGYDGRLASARTVLLQANQMPLDAAVVTGDGRRVFVREEPLAAVDEAGHEHAIRFGWSRALWDAPPPLSVEVTGHVSPWGALRRVGRAAVIDGAATSSPFNGYPRDWNSAVRAGRLDPYPHPYFQATQKTPS